MNEDIPLAAPVLCLAGFLVFVPLVGGVLGPVVEEGFSPRRECVYRVNCARNLRQLGLGLHMYSGDNQERFPDSLDELQPYVKQRELFSCVERPNSPDRLYPAFGTLDASSDFYYVAGLTEANASDMVHMFEHPGDHNGEGANVLYVGGYVQWIPMDGCGTELGFWPLLESAGITRDMVDSATNKIIRLPADEDNRSAP